MAVRMRETKDNRNNIGEVIERLKDAVVEHRKIVLPVVLAAAILITMGIGMAANRKNEEQEEVQANAAGTVEEAAVQSEGLTVPDVLLEENAYPEVNELIMKYYKAMEEKNPDALSEIMNPVNENALLYFNEMSKQIQACPSVNIYTKPGPREDSFLAYVRVDVQIMGYEETVPGLNTFFICKNDAGNYYINGEDEIDKEEADYIKAVNFQEDVKDLNNKINVEFNQLLAEKSEAAEAFKKINENITKGMQESLLAKQEEQAPQEAEQESGETAQPEMVATEVKATTVVNKRGSDSEKADKLGKAQVGDTFKVLEQRPNGWTKLTDGTEEFFIKSEYLEVTAEEPAGETVIQEETPAETEDTQTTEQETPAADTLPGRNGKVTAKTTVNVRKSASETGEKLGVIYQGEQLELVMNQADGWTKVKYKGQTAYVKTEFVE